mgnify:CR=1 FL=1
MHHDNDNELPRTAGEAKALGLKRYNTGKPCKHGHVADRLVSNNSCLECANTRAKKWAADNDDYLRQKRKDYYATNKETVLANWSTWYSDNHERQLARKRARYQANREKELAYAKRYRLKNRDKILAANKRWKENNPEKVKNDWDEWYAENGKAWGAAQRSIPRNRIDMAMSSGIRLAIADKKAGRRWETMVGYSLDDLMRHLEKRFQPGMSWENYGKGGWHIDHVIPKVVFNYTAPEHEDFKRCWALSNLQPLWEPDNLSKHAKLTKQFQPTLALELKSTT